MINASDRQVEPSSRWREWLTLVLLWLAVAGIYWNPNQPGKSLLAMDYDQLHARRMQFARDAIFGTPCELPAWYPREMLGTPFRANLQNFPLIPNRLLITLLMDPHGAYTYAAAITLAAILAATFTFLFARRIGLGLLASAGAGWTFACCGYFAARVGAGHLPLLEAFCALPLLLWGTESLTQAFERSDSRSIRIRFLALFLSAGCMLLAGHPQITLYSLAATTLYALLRSNLRRAGWIAILAMALGGLCAGFALVPMMLLIGQSTRLLPLDPAANDITLPWNGLLGFFIPWPGGTPNPIPRDPMNGIPSSALFWDTFCYIGYLPWLATCALLIHKLRRGLPVLPKRIAMVLILLGVGGAVLALPILRGFQSIIPGTLLRSPARLLYLTEFALSISLAAAVQLAMASARLKAFRWVIPALLAAHAFDLGSTDMRFFVQLPDTATADAKDIWPAIADLRDERVAIDKTLALEWNRRFDDIGVFDSILLAGPYQWLFKQSGWRATLNRQDFDGSELPAATLKAAGVRYVVTQRTRDDLPLAATVRGVKIYRIADPAPRASFIPIPAAAGTSWQVESERVFDDQIRCLLGNNAPGTLRIIEAWNPGWTATVDGMESPVNPTEGALISLQIDRPGVHDVRLTYHTPGAMAGIVISIVGVLTSLGAAMIIPRLGRLQNPAWKADPN